MLFIAAAGNKLDLKPAGSKKSLIFIKKFLKFVNCSEFRLKSEKCGAEKK